MPVVTTRSTAERRLDQLLHSHQSLRAVLVRLSTMGWCGTAAETADKVLWRAMSCPTTPHQELACGFGMRYMRKDQGLQYDEVMRSYPPPYVVTLVVPGMGKRIGLRVEVGTFLNV